MGIDSSGGRAHLEPEVYVECAFADAGLALDTLLAATDVNRLPGVDLARLRGAPRNSPASPRPRNDDPFSFEFRQRVRLLGGFG